MRNLTICTTFLIIAALPFLMLRLSLPGHAHTPKEYCLEVWFPAKLGCGPPESRETDWMQRNYKTFYLTNDTHQNAVVMQCARQLLKRIRTTKDLDNAVVFRMADDTPFEDYIACLDVCREGEPKRFAPLPDRVCAFYITIPSAPDHGGLVPYK